MYRCPGIFFSMSTAEYFIMQFYYGLGDVDKWSGYRFAGFVDYCAVDNMSKLEIVDMAKALKLDVEGANFWFKEINSD